MSLKKYYLARSGNISGPFTEQDINELERRGEIFRYNWIWKPGETDWKALDPAPSINPELRVEGEALDESNEAYCLVGQGILKGSLRNSTELGFELRMNESWTLPPVGKGMQIQVLREGSASNGRLDTMKILEITREDSEWVLFLRHT